MIPHDYITAWRAHAPWVQDFQVEQDLIISRALVEIFSDSYMNREGARVTRALFERNLAEKMADPQFTADIEPLLSPGYVWNVEEAGQQVSQRLISKLPGDPWKGERQ